jgi:hypothetical protein
VSERRDLLELVLSAEVLAVLDEHIRDVVAEAVRQERARQPRREWLTLAEAAVEYGCTEAAMRMRAKRGTVETRRQGRRLYVRANGAPRE